MSPRSWMSWFVAGGAVCALLPSIAMAQSLDQVLNAQERRIRLAQESQDRIDNVVKQTRSLEDQYKSVLKEIEGLEVYNTLLQRQVDNQELQLADLDESLQQVEVINRQIVPIMTKMIESLEQFIELDVPFLLKERTERIAGLWELMERQDVTVAEKFRKVTEAFQIENDYGSTIEAYKDTLEVDGATRQMDFLRIGRIALLYQSEDGKVSGVWDQREGQYKPLGNEYRNQIKFGLQIARKQVAPDLVLLPVDAPEAG
jgi:septal ring factor EnvC (AmiA/AmiB activator)